MYRLTNPRMDYAWGSVDLLPTLMGSAPDGRPLAEIWMGAHAAAPSTVEVDGREVGLDAFIRGCPDETLGARAATEQGARLPFLMKLLAADKPLSLQVHPTSEQAVAGFHRENAAGLAPSDPTRNYRDDAHKPEMLFALTEFELMCGFRPAATIRTLLAGLEVAALDPVVEALGAPDPARALETALTMLLAAAPQRQALVTREVVRSARERQDGRPEYVLVGELARQYPDDIGIVASLFLNHLRIQPGESVFVGAGMVHSYLRGLGVELMAASDNVLRAGLTSKHVDVRELLRLVDFRSGEPLRLPPTTAGEAVVYVPPVPDFALWTLASDPSDGRRSGHAVAGPSGGARIAVCCAGSATLTRASERLDLTPGQAAFIPHSDGPLEISTTGIVAVAYRS